MKTLPFSKLRSFVLLLALLILTGGAGYYLGERRVRLIVTPKRVVVNQEPPSGQNVDFNLFWDVWQRLFRYHIDRVNLDAQKMVWGAVSGMVNAVGDPYTIFLTPGQNREFKDDLGGEFEGIGAQLGLEDGRIIVVSPLKGTPAEIAGLRPKDIILKVNEEETVNWTVAQAVSKIRGPGGTTVTLTVIHEGEPQPTEVKIMRGKITVPSVEWWVKKPGEIGEFAGIERTKQVAYLRLSRFGDRTNSDWEKAVTAISKAVAENGSLAGMILDLRHNPGGYLEGSVFIASEFVEKGIIVSQVNSDGSRENYEVNRKGKLLAIPLVVLINKGSASAAEIVAGALRDHKRAILVGETTFGKGSVQTPFDLSGGAGVHITTGKWLLPKGGSISKTGVKPDVEVKLDNSPQATVDAQLVKAVELLLK